MYVPSTLVQFSAVLCPTKYVLLICPSLFCLFRVPCYFVLCLSRSIHYNFILCYMMEVWRSLTLGAWIFGFVFLYSSMVESCNEVVCAPIVSKCLLTQSCKCELKNSSCYQECLKCLGRKFYEECCSCVGKSKDVNINHPSNQSYVSTEY